MHWGKILPGLFRYKDSCNVYAVAGDAGLVFINAGTGKWLESLDELPGEPVVLLCTHYFRDHAAGAIEASRRGIEVYVPEGEHSIFSDPQHHFQQRETYIIYDNLWDLYAPIEATPDVQPFYDYESKILAGIEFESVPLPGVTLTQSGYAMMLNGKRIIFCGEAIHSSGRLARLAPLQYNYNDIPGAWNVYWSAGQLRKQSFDALLPSLGQPILEKTDDALSQLQESMRVVLDVCGTGLDKQLPILEQPDITKVTDHVWLSARSSARSWFLIGESGKVMALDYGYAWDYVLMQGCAQPKRRRALLHGLDGLKRQFGIDRIDVALISHFHDDHVCGVPTLQRLFGTECWASETFADLLTDPAAHCFPCTWPVPIKVHRKIPIDQKVSWEQFTFHFAPMSGHTRFSSLIGFEVDGKRFAHTGDQYFFRNGIESFENNRVTPNHVYRNGALLDGYAQSATWMLDWRPDIVLTGHTDAIHTDENYFHLIEQWTREYESVHRQAMVLGDDEAHFNLDSWGGWIWPYRTHLKEPRPVKVRVTVRNPYPRPARLELRLVGPQGWLGESTTLEAKPRGEHSCELSITPNGPCRRQPFTVELTVDGQPFGQVAEAQITVGGLMF